VPSRDWGSTPDLSSYGSNLAPDQLSLPPAAAGRVAWLEPTLAVLALELPQDPAGAGPGADPADGTPPHRGPKPGRKLLGVWCTISADRLPAQLPAGPSTPDVANSALPAPQRDG